MLRDQHCPLLRCLSFERCLWNTTQRISHATPLALREDTCAVQRRLVLSFEGCEVTWSRMRHVLFFFSRYVSSLRLLHEYCHTQTHSVTDLTYNTQQLYYRHHNITVPSTDRG
ncbi:hypothetical protein EON64_00095 [archaeon]|nr:MAG: hypothetical protein EON64_00095 [archaeon]